MRRALAPLLAVSALVLLGLLAPTVASAGPLRAAAPQSCDPAEPYPFGPDATVEVGTTFVTVGDTIEVSGVKYCPDEDVRITIDGRTVGTAHTDPTGRFDPRVEVPGPAGDKEVCGVGASGLSQDADCLTVNARAAAGGNGAPDDTALTGVEIALLGVVALIAIVGGVIFTTLGRSRRTARI